MITWAKSRIGNPDYASWCLSFIEDALEISNDIEIFGGDSAKESCELYRDALHDGCPERGTFVFYDCLCPSEDGPVNWGHCGMRNSGKLRYTSAITRQLPLTEKKTNASNSGRFPRRRC